MQLIPYMDDIVFVSERDNILQLVFCAMKSIVSTLQCFKKEKSVPRREERRIEGREDGDVNQC